MNNLNYQKKLYKQKKAEYLYLKSKMSGGGDELSIVLSDLFKVKETVQKIQEKTLKNLENMQKEISRLVNELNTSLVQDSNDQNKMINILEFKMNSLQLLESCFEKNIDLYTEGEYQILDDCERNRNKYAC